MTIPLVADNDCELIGLVLRSVVAIACSVVETIIHGRGNSGLDLVLVVDEMAPMSVRAESVRMEGSTELALVFRMPCHVSKFGDPVSELTASTVLADPVFFVRSTQLSFVA